MVFEIPDVEVGALDKAEGYRPGRDSNSYWRRECMVFLNGEDRRPLTVSTYFAEPQENPPLPSSDYKNLIVAGARHWHLPAHYIAQVDAIEVAG